MQFQNKFEVKLRNIYENVRKIQPDEFKAINFENIIEWGEKKN